MKRVWFALGLACLACCLPLIVPLLGGAGFVGFGAWAGGVNWTEVACLALIAGIVVTVGFFILRKNRADGPACDVRD